MLISASESIMEASEAIEASSSGPSDLSYSAPQLSKAGQLLAVPMPSMKRSSWSSSVTCSRASAGLDPSAFLAHTPKSLFRWPQLARDENPHGLRRLGMIPEAFEDLPGRRRILQTATYASIKAFSIHVPRKCVKYKKPQRADEQPKES